MKRLSILLIAGLFFLGTTGCEDAGSTSSEDLAEEIQQDIERELDRARERIEDARDRVEEAQDRLEEDNDMRESRDRVRRSVESGMESLGSILEEVGESIRESSDIQPVDWRKLEDLLPSDVEGFERSKRRPDGETIGAFGFRYSKVEAEYVDGSDELTLVLIDLGSMQGLAGRGLDYLDTELDAEDRDGFEKTREFGGYPGYFRVKRDFNEDEMTGVAIVEDRFLVVAEAKGRDLEDDLIEEAMEAMSLRRLKRLAD